MAKKYDIGDFPFGALAPKAPKLPKKPKVKQTASTRQAFALAKKKAGPLHGRSGS